jgi:hypothetical protein
MDIWIWWLTGRMEAVLIAMAIYIVTPALTLEYASLTSRSLGNLMFTLLMICLSPLVVSQGYDWSALLIVGSLVAAMWFLILMTHKLTMQLGIFVAGVMVYGYGSVIPLIILGAMVPLSIILTKGYYWKVLKGHWDIVTFWNRHLRELDGHQVYDSKLYYDGTKSMLEKNRIAVGMRGRIEKSLGYNPFIYVVGISLVIGAASSPEMRYLGLWVIAVLAWAMLTTFVPYLKAFGEGYKYMKYSAVPAAMLCGVVMSEVGSSSVYLVFGLAAIISALIIGRSVARRWGVARICARKGDGGREEIIQYIKENEHVDRIGCVSHYNNDAVVYHARRKVLWGTHHYCFNTMIRDFYPVFHMPIEDVSRKYGLGYWLVDASYVEPSTLGFDSTTIEHKCGLYELHRAGHMQRAEIEYY